MRLGEVPLLPEMPPPAGERACWGEMAGDDGRGDAGSRPASAASTRSSELLARANGDKERVKHRLLQRLKALGVVVEVKAA